MPARRSARSRGWCFTINNPTVDDEEDWEALKLRCQYAIKGNERGEERETPHWQGYVYFLHPTTLNGVKGILRRAHLESQRGTITDAVEYCKKEGDFVEYGRRPHDPLAGKQKNEQWTQCINWAEQGKMELIKNHFPQLYLRYFERLRSLRLPSTSILEELTHEWWVGPTGTGKSRRLWDLYPKHFQKELNKWWCGYDGEEVVAIEEWCPKNECTASFLKIWADRYPFTGQIKGGSLRKIRPKKIIVLSNYTIEQCFPNIEDCDPIKRRFTVLNFPLDQEEDDMRRWLDTLETINERLQLPEPETESTEEGF